MPRQCIVTDTGRPAVFGDAQFGQLCGGEGVLAGASAQINAGSGIVRQCTAVVKVIYHGARIAVSFSR